MLLVCQCKLLLQLLGVRNRRSVLALYLCQPAF